MIGSGALLAVVVSGRTGVAMADRMGKGAEGPFPRFDFSAIDANKDGKITRQEIAAERTARVALVDTDKDGKLSAPELKAQALARAGSRADELVARMIARHDSDGDGLISLAEMAAGPSSMPFFDRIDSDKDGAISVDEVGAARKLMARYKGARHGQGGPDDGPEE